MKKVLLTLLAGIVILGVLAGAGYVGYRIGFNQGAGISGSAQYFGRADRMDPHLMPGLDRDFGFRTQPYYHSPMMRNSHFGFSIFSPLRILWNIGILALIIWFVYWLFTKSGWRITRQKDNASDVPPTEIQG